MIRNGSKRIWKNVINETAIKTAHFVRSVYILIKLDTLLLRQDTLLLRIDGLNSTIKYLSQAST